jgi:hypothetical protein
LENPLATADPVNAIGSSQLNVTIAPHTGKGDEGLFQQR